MKRLFDSIPDALAPEMRLDTGLNEVPLLPPDDNDIVRPVEEEMLGSANRVGGGRASLVHARMSKHLLWTFGPSHRDLPFMIQMRTEIEGERFVAVDPEIGWLHQGIERQLETASVREAFSLLSGLYAQDSVAYEIAYLLCCEALLDDAFVLDKDVERYRVILLELSRIQQHLRTLSDVIGVYADVRAKRTFSQSRHQLRDLLEEMRGSTDAQRHRSLGGLLGDLPHRQLGQLGQRLTAIISPTQNVAQNILARPSVTEALLNIGRLSAADAIGRGLSGPALRATGVADDVRTRAPYLSYDEVVPTIITDSRGDTLARITVRLDEIAQSSAVAVRNAQKISTDVSARPGVQPPDDLFGGQRHVSASLETASGELSVSLQCGAAGLQRVRVRGPSFPLAQALGHVLQGARLDDAMTIFSSLGILGTELDR